MYCQLKLIFLLRYIEQCSIMRHEYQVFLSLISAMLCLTVGIFQLECLRTGDSVTMKGPISRWAFSLGFLVGACSIYFFLHQVWFERSFSILSEAQEKATDMTEDKPMKWRKDGAALVNLLHPHHAGT